MLGAKIHPSFCVPHKSAQRQYKRSQERAVVAESTLMHHEIRVARPDWSDETTYVGKISFKASFMDQPSSIADIDSKIGKLLHAAMEACA